MTSAGDLEGLCREPGNQRTSVVREWRRLHRPPRLGLRSGTQRLVSATRTNLSTRVDRTSSLTAIPTGGTRPLAPLGACGPTLDYPEPPQRSSLLW